MHLVEATYDFDWFFTHAEEGKLPYLHPEVGGFGPGSDIMVIKIYGEETTDTEGRIVRLVRGVYVVAVGL